MSNIIQRIFRFTGLEKGYGHIFLGAAVAVTLGCIVDRSEVHRMIIFRDKSALFGRELKEGEPPSWPSKHQYFN